VNLCIPPTDSVNPLFSFQINIIINNLLKIVGLGVGKHIAVYMVRTNLGNMRSVSSIGI